MIGIFRSSCDSPLRWMPKDLTHDQSILVQVMVWCCQATSHYLNQCWPRSLPPYGVTRPQWVNTTKPTFYVSCNFFFSILNALGLLFFFRKHKNKIAFSDISGYSEGARHRQTSSEQQGSQYPIINTIVADHLAPCGARVSAANSTDSVLHEYFHCWWPGNVRRQGNSSLVST